MPQFAQNFEPGGFIVAQPVQAFGVGAIVVPHSAQNFPGGTRAPHWVQFTWPSLPTLGVGIAIVGAVACAPP